MFPFNKCPKWTILAGILGKPGGNKKKKEQIPEPANWVWRYTHTRKHAMNAPTGSFSAKRIRRFFKQPMSKKGRPTTKEGEGVAAVARVHGTPNGRSFRSVFRRCQVLRLFLAGGKSRTRTFLCYLIPVPR
jgi:hypothetical protein